MLDVAVQIAMCVEIYTRGLNEMSVNLEYVQICRCGLLYNSTPLRYRCPLCDFKETYASEMKKLNDDFDELGEIVTKLTGLLNKFVDKVERALKRV